ncbi:MAG: GPR endopeptidase [Victivallis vadensis]
MGIRTDLAMEERELRASELPAGVRCRERQEQGFHLTEIEIRDSDAAEALHKPVGRYITLELSSEQLRCAASDCAAALSAELASLLPPEGPFLVIGLGNRAVTPDAIGPLTLRQVLATRHLRSALPDLFGSFREVSTLPTGVLGDTGLESAEIVRSLVQETKPRCVLAIDALASARPERLCRSIQLTDAGIAPGSGVHNDRRPLCRDSLGVPVLGIGVPTVCDLRSLVETEEEMIVTPGRIDAQISDLARILGAAINQALHPEIPPEDLAEFVGTV